MSSTNSSERLPAANTRKPRRMAREPKSAAATSTDSTIPATKPAKRASKLDIVAALLLAPTGASIAELVVATGWQQNSVRGAMAGALKKRGLAITSDKIDGLRRYRAKRPA